MTEPDRIWINDKWEAYLRPTFDGDTSGYVRADLARTTTLARPAPLAEALAVPEIAALVSKEAATAREVFEDYGSKAKEAIDYMEQLLLAALRAIGEGK